MAILLCVSIIGNAQSIEDMESCTFNGESINWNDWGEWGCEGQPGCAIICSSEQSYSGDWSGLVNGNQTVSSFIDLGNKIFGVWGLEFYMFVPSGKEAHFNIQAAVPIGDGDSIVGDFTFNKNLESPGIGSITDTALGEVFFNFPHDEWFRIVMNFDFSFGISLATWQLSINDAEIIPLETPFSSYSGVPPSSLGGLLFISISENNEYYIDDIFFQDEFIEDSPYPMTDDMESCTTDGETIELDPWTDWGCGGGQGCAIQCSSNYAHSGDWSGLIPGDGTTDAILNLGNKIFGTWGVEFWAYIPSNKEAFIEIKECVPICASDWPVWAYFNPNLDTPGEGVFMNTILGDVNFSFPNDQWFKIVINVDLTAGIASGTWGIFINGNEVIPSGTPFKDINNQVPFSFGGLGFFSISNNNELYVDDFLYQDEFIEVLPGSFEDDMEYPDGPPYGPWWTCWLDETNCEPFVVGPGEAHEGEYCGLIPGDEFTEETLDLGDQISGEWGLEFYMFVPSGKEAFWNLQGTVPIGAGEWIVGYMYFNQDNATPGQGIISDTAIGEVYFDFPHDEWFRVAMNFDLSLGIDAATWGMSVNNILAVPEGLSLIHI